MNVLLIFLIFVVSSGILKEDCPSQSTVTNADVTWEGVCSINGDISVRDTGIIRVVSNSVLTPTGGLYVTNKGKMYMSGESTINALNSYFRDTSYFYMNDNSTITTETVTSNYYGNINLEDNSSLIVLKGFQLYDYSTLAISNNALIKVTDFSVYNNIAITMNGSDMVQAVEATTFLCKTNSTLYTTGTNYFIINITTLDVGCIINSTRTIKDTPIFFTDTLTLNSLEIKSSLEFNLAYVRNGFTQQIVGTTLLEDGKLVRYGTSKTVYCHLYGKIIKQGNFIEEYCPSSEDEWYVVPKTSQVVIESIFSAKSSNKKSRHHLKSVSNVLSVAGYNILLDDVDDVVLDINVDSEVAVNVTSVSKSVFIASKNGFIFGTTVCYIGQVTNNVFQCNRLKECYEGKFDLTLRLCSPCTDLKCKKCMSVESTSTSGECVQCVDGYLLNDGNCEEDAFCIFAEKNVCLKCKEGKSLLDGKCVNITNNCLVTGSTVSECQICEPNSMYINRNGKCEEVDNTIKDHTVSSVLSCSSQYYINGTSCTLCPENCIQCTQTTCLQCANGYEMFPHNKCVLKTCGQDIYKSSDVNGRCVTEISNCKQIENGLCVECKESYILNNGMCTSEQNKECSVQNSYGCIRCIDKMYSNDKNKCELCDSSCLTCSSISTQCLSCPSGTYIDENTCKSNSELQGKCKTFSLTGNGCYECEDGYYRSDLDCKNCSESCSTCNNAERCLTCSSAYYMSSDNECLMMSSLIGCGVEVTQSGCSKCALGFYTYKNNQCKSCNSCCTECYSALECTKCLDGFILVDSTCNSLSNVQKCLQIGDSKCSKCSFWYSPSSEGTYCLKKAEWWVITLIVIVVLFFIVIICILLYYFTVHVVKAIHLKKIQKDFNIFKIETSNIQFNTLKNGIVVNLTEVDFNRDKEEIPICQETSQPICVGNISTKLMKVQFSIKESEEKYSLRVFPAIVLLKKGEACEFQLNITPNYTSTIKGTIIIVSQDVKSGEETLNTISIQAETVLSTRLDPNELNEEKQIGEGGFGIVFMGTYRNNVVAIKMMKQGNETSETNSEFENEVLMLDKFRCDYIVHFYGAVFIPTKICMVTEFAPYGSLSDLKKKKKITEVDMKMRIKFCLDAAKGIQYLHTNGILHRDIKPDNILIVSLDNNIAVNGKLTDFGSSRNINMLMTNMTFTKGIGTPVYMAPEILDKKKYKKPADVYSFAITVYECLGWCNAYPISEFKFPWSIAEFVTSKKRLSKTVEMTTEMFELIKSMWPQDPKDRITMEEIVDGLNQLFVCY
ncbi:protein serine/threonine kinase, putative [Entamoeba invadens IP1]|uniref:Protein serine/threonine kinase, putative n=1 Tax=Entamoeba invadens IP1 TaxID=370355 RepID=A0A0A1TYF6_ENTIV|nr:protein serine/threonine kinase, putative [Entamoeba invadens IP1]ELP84585.1 protein serine/threonine kinase, putative [Entamoeba invadens IP1]|eukprot:XP_004183931.1 protein serine/threonine kinase, putative [Entamoeba invadens IP1]